MLPDDDRIVETCRSILNNFICFNVLKLCTSGNNKNNPLKVFKKKKKERFSDFLYQAEIGRLKFVLYGGLYILNNIQYYEIKRPGLTLGERTNTQKKCVYKNFYFILAGCTTFLHLSAPI